MPPKTFIRDTKNYWVLAEYTSKSNPSGKRHEVRTSKNDGKTYCSCPGWIFGVKNGKHMCKHLKEFSSAKPEEKVSIYTHEEFLRRPQMTELPEVKGTVTPRRTHANPT